MIKGIIFDKDGTLVELGDSWDQPTIEVVDLLLSQSELSLEEQKDFKLSMGVTDTHILSNSTVAAGSIEDQAKVFQKVLPLPLAEIIQTIENYFYQFFLTNQEPIPVIDGVFDCLKTLKEQNYFLGIVTNDNQRLTEIMLERSGLMPYFDFIGSADQYGSKPNSIAFDIIEKEHGLKLNELVYVGDSAVDMAYGSQTQAAIGLALDEAHLEHLEKADYIIRSFDELDPLLSKLNDHISKKKKEVPMKKKTIVSYAVLASMFFQAISVTTFAQESDASSSVTDSEVISDETEEAATDLFALNKIELVEGNPVSLIDALYAQPSYVTSGVNYLDAINDETFAVRSLRYVRDGESYYLMLSAPETINSTILIETDEGKFKESYIPSDDLMASMAEGLNNYPDLYAGTAVEEFYQYAQMNSDSISGLLINNDYATDTHQLIFNEVQAIDAYLLSHLKQFFEAEGNDFTVVDSEIGDIYYYEVTDDNHENFQTVMLEGQDDESSEEVQALQTFFSQEFTGSIAISMETGSISLSMLNDEGAQAIEYNIRLDQVAVARAEDEQVITADEFNEMIGIELFAPLETSNSDE